MEIKIENGNRYLRSGPFGGDVTDYPDGTGVCIWLPMDEVDDSFGLAFDFSLADIDDLIQLLQYLKHFPHNVSDSEGNISTPPLKTAEDHLNSLGRTTEDE